MPPPTLNYEEPTNGRCGAESGGIESGDAFTNERRESDPALVNVTKRECP